MIKTLKQIIDEIKNMRMYENHFVKVWYPGLQDGGFFFIIKRRKYWVYPVHARYDENVGKYGDYMPVGDKITSDPIYVGPLDGVIKLISEYYQYKHFQGG
ncbi:MAG: hypothetical protein QXM39_04295 [Thermoplasmata archaeon]